ncbi:hypothetical protein TRFO_31288 [Tritrichomonas foetus]|uniref:Uncharacterized protein n=1 Tax=Tritrichomonas foetus TaxID=1144522 RepID=A0A1J4JRV6_9EUKA|nr:hypothetical protein TRFO_31288 [Tritrichomonas foetus]|eukprot:OHT01771.1 hypothetical protein TRFO_31288 [Tritrichomonas foetus]
MSNQFRFQISKDLNQVLNCAIFVGGHRYPLIKELAISNSGLIKKLFESSNEVKIDYENENKEFQCIANLFCCSVVTFNKRNIAYIIKTSQFFEMDELFESAQNFQKRMNHLEKILSQPNELSNLMKLESSIFSISEETFLNVKTQISAFIQSNFDANLVARIIFRACFARSPQISLLVKLAGENDDICEKLSEMALNEFNEKKDPFLPNEINFILFYLIEDGKLPSDILMPKAKTMPFWVNLTDRENHLQHIELIKIGENPDDIPNAIRHDDCDTLQLLMKTSNFDLNGRATSSIYECISFINKKQTYVEYAAFFGSIKCFKYLTLNGARFPRYAFEVSLAGGHVEMIRLIAQQQEVESSYNNSCFNTILFHRKELFDWLILNHPNAVKNYEILAQKCIDESSYLIFESLLMEGANPNGQNKNPLLITAVLNDNLRLLDFLLKIEFVDPNAKDKNDNTVLHIACAEEKEEIVKFLMSNPKIDKNAKGVFKYMFYKVFIN